MLTISRRGPIALRIALTAVTIVLAVPCWASMKIWPRIELPVATVSLSPRYSDPYIQGPPDGRFTDWQRGNQSALPGDDDSSRCGISYYRGTFYFALSGHSQTMADGSHVLCIEAPQGFLCVQIEKENGVTLGYLSENGFSPFEGISIQSARQTSGESRVDVEFCLPSAFWTGWRDFSRIRVALTRKTWTLARPRNGSLEISGAGELRLRPPEEVPARKHWALVIGISDYRDEHVPDLRFAARDAEEFAAWLVTPSGGRYDEDCVRLLTNEKATAENMRASLFEWLKRPLAEDTVTIFFAGHGTPESPDSMENLFLLTHDSDYAKVASTAFPMWDIETALKRFIVAERVIVLVDACHAAGVGSGFDVSRRNARGLKVKSVNNGLTKLGQFGKGICVLNASTADQLSQEGERWGGGHGVFTYVLLRGLTGEADADKDSIVTVGELAPFLSEEVRRETSSAQCPAVAGQYEPTLTIGRQDRMHNKAIDSDEE